MFFFVVSYQYDFFFSSCVVPCDYRMKICTACTNDEKIGCIDVRTSSKVFSIVFYNLVEEVVL